MGDSGKKSREVPSSGDVSGSPVGKSSRGIDVLRNIIVPSNTKNEIGSRQGYNPENDPSFKVDKSNAERIMKDFDRRRVAARGAKNDEELAMELLKEEEGKYTGATEKLVQQLSQEAATELAAWERGTGK